MNLENEWFLRPLPNKMKVHASETEEGCNGKTYRRGQFLPFYVPRAVMPQIDEADEPDFIAFAESRGAVIVREVVHPGQLLSHQRVEISHAMNMNPEVLAKPALVSKEGYVLDGNHRWYAHKLQGTDMNVIRVMLEFEAAIELMFEFPKTYDLEVQGNEIRN